MSQNSFHLRWPVNQEPKPPWDSLGVCPCWSEPRCPHWLLIRVWEALATCAGFGFLSEPSSTAALRPETCLEGKGMVPPLPFPKPHLHTRPIALLRTQPPCYNGLWRSEQLSYKSLFIGISSNLPIPKLHLNQWRERERRRGEVPPLPPLLEKQLTTSFIW